MSGKSRVTIESMKRRKKTHTDIPLSPTVGIVLLVILVGIIWGVGVILSYRSSSHLEHNQKHLPYERKAKAQKKLTEKILHGMPDDVDIWPLDEQHPEFFKSLRSCLPTEQDKKCRQRKDYARLGILRAPGVLGRVIEQFVTKYIEIHKHQDKDHLEIVPTSHIDGRERVHTKIIRVTVLPLLLEAVDLTLQTVDGEEFSRDMIRLDDVLGVVRLLVRWHCRLSDIAKDTALENLSLGKTMAFAKFAEDVLEEFLGFDMIKENGEEVNVANEDLALQTIHRLDECILFITELQGATKKTAADINSLIDAIIQEEAEHEHCQTTMNMLEHRVTEIVGHFLAVSEHTAKIVCHKYPKIPMCLDEYQSTPH